MERQNTQQPQYYPGFYGYQPPNLQNVTETSLTLSTLADTLANERFHYAVRRSEYRREIRDLRSQVESLTQEIVNNKMENDAIKNRNFKLEQQNNKNNDEVSRLSAEMLKFQEDLNNMVSQLAEYESENLYLKAIMSGYECFDCDDCNSECGMEAHQEDIFEDGSVSHDNISEGSVSHENISEGYDGPYHGRYLWKYANGWKKGVGRFDTLEEAIEKAAELREDGVEVGGITYEAWPDNPKLKYREGYTLRVGSQLFDGGSEEEVQKFRDTMSWVFIGNN